MIDSIQIYNYAICFGGCVANNANSINSKIGGVAPIINNLIIPYMIQINRINVRIMEIQLKTAKYT